MAHERSEPSAIDDRDDSSGSFTTETAGLPDVARPRIERLKDGDRFDLRIAPVRKKLDGADLRMLAYNGSIPGPTLHVDQGSEITVQSPTMVTSTTTVHWHGLRWRTATTACRMKRRQPIPIGGTFTYKVQFPDAGLLLVPPAHPRGLRDRRWGCTARSSSSPPTPSYWPGRRPAADAHAWTTCSSRTDTSRRSASQVRTSLRWAASATSC